MRIATKYKKSKGFLLIIIKKSMTMLHLKNSATKLRTAEGNSMTNKNESGDRRCQQKEIQTFIYNFKLDSYKEIR